MARSTAWRLVMAQGNFLVGDIVGNTQKVLDLARAARDNHADLVVFPELTLIGYPPEDLLLRPSLATRIDAALARLGEVAGITLVLGYPGQREGGFFNLLGVWRDGRCLGEYAKQELPNYDVFDEVRYFQPGHAPLVVDGPGCRIGLTVCEDIWHQAPAAAAREAGAELLININASPFHVDKQAERIGVLQARIAETGLPVVYVNLVGGQDELVFDGGSLVINAQGEVLVEAPLFAEGLYAVDFVGATPVATSRPAAMAEEASVYAALVLGVRDYVQKNRFRGAVLGLSGGIDSALTLAIAVDALGAERVQAVMMPFHYTSTMSLEDAEAEARCLGVQYSVLGIAPIFDAFAATLAGEFAGAARDKTEENLQARARGVLLMAISNKKGYLVLTTGNKSEMAVGYATLYGDMAGGFDVLKDVPKTLVFRLSAYRNSLTPDAPPIPQRVIDRPPSAELAPDQKDEDSLPPYPVLDEILRRYVEKDESAEAIVAAGFARDDVWRVLRMVDLNEYKRRQAAVGPRITRRAFGKDRRYPIVNGWDIGQ